MRCWRSARLASPTGRHPRSATRVSARRDHPARLLLSERSHAGQYSCARRGSCSPPQRKCRAPRYRSPRLPRLRGSSTDSVRLALVQGAVCASSNRASTSYSFRGEPAVSCWIRAVARRPPSTSRGSACASSGRCSRHAERGETAECVANRSSGRGARDDCWWAKARGAVIGEGR
jgi:hypothetical protein